MKIISGFSAAFGIAATLLSPFAVAEDNVAIERCPGGICSSPVRDPFGPIQLPTLTEGVYGIAGFSLDVGASGVALTGNCSQGTYSLAATGLTLQTDTNDKSIEYITFTGSMHMVGSTFAPPANSTEITLWATIPSDQTSGGLNEPTTWTMTYGDSTTIGSSGIELTLGAPLARIMCG